MLSLNNIYAQTDPPPQQMYVINQGASWFTVRTMEVASQLG